MLKFKDRFECRGSIRYKIYRNNHLITNCQPSSDDSRGDIEWSTRISKIAVELINYELADKKKKPITLSEEKQMFDFYFKGDILGFKEEIKKHKEAIKNLREKLKNG